MIGGVVAASTGRGLHQALMIDSGALRTVVNPKNFHGRQHDDSMKRKLFDISGNQIPHFGNCMVDYECMSGRVCSLKTDLCEVTRDIMSVVQRTENGLTYVFSPQGACMTKEAIPKPAEHLVE